MLFLLLLYLGIEMQQINRNLWDEITEELRELDGCQNRWVESAYAKNRFEIKGAL